MTIHQLDVERAFIYAPLHEDAYMHANPAMIPRGHYQIADVNVWFVTIATQLECAFTWFYDIY